MEKVTYTQVRDDEGHRIYEGDTLVDIKENKWKVIRNKSISPESKFSIMPSDGNDNIYNIIMKDGQDLKGYISLSYTDHKADDAKLDLIDAVLYKSTPEEDEYYDKLNQLSTYFSSLMERRATEYHTWGYEAYHDMVEHIHEEIFGKEENNN